MQELASERLQTAVSSPIYLREVVEYMAFFTHDNTPPLLPTALRTTLAHEISIVTIDLL